MSIAEIKDGFKTKKADLKVVKKGPSLSRRFGGLIGSLVARVSGLVLPVLGLASFTVGAWQVRPWVGMIMLGVSFFVLDYGRDD